MTFKPASRPVRTCRARHPYPDGMPARLNRSLGPALGLAAILLLQAGCATTPGRSSAGGGTPVVNPGQQSNTGWPFWPQVMRIHPLSQFVKDRQTGHFLLEVRVEFSDPFGHTSKAYGEIVIALHDARPAFDDNEIAGWTEDLTDLQENQVFFDDVTGTYLFRLEIEDLDLADESEIRIIFHSADGAMLQDAYVVQK